VRVTSSDGGGVGGAGVEDCVCTSSRAAAEDERNRRGVLLALERWRTHRIHVLNCRIDGGTDAMAIGRGDANVVCHLLPPENVRSLRSWHSFNHRPRTRTLKHHHFRHGFHEDISADAGRHTSIEQTADTAGCPLESLHSAPPVFRICMQC
jgi:hypothetical protein